MLTEIQKSKLEPLTHHPKYGKLLIDAMKTWDFTTPSQNTIGITRWESDRFTDDVIPVYKWKIDEGYNNCCCLVGAFLLGKDSHHDVWDSISISFNISRSNVRQLIDGFDGVINSVDSNHEGYQFAKSVSQCLFE